jgi:hypothetical protein
LTYGTVKGGSLSLADHFDGRGALLATLTMAVVDHGLELKVTALSLRVGEILQA